MLPITDNLTQNITEIVYPNRTYKIVFNKDINPNRNLDEESNGVTGLTISVDVDSMDRISGYIDDLEALTQTIYLILSTERYQHIIYSWDYGIELVDLFGKPMSYVMLEIQSRIKEALLYDNRVEDVVDFEFEHKGKVLTTKFTVVSNVGNLTTALEVKI